MVEERDVIHVVDDEGGTIGSCNNVAPNRWTPYVMIDENSIVRDSTYLSWVPGNG